MTRFKQIARNLERRKREPRRESERGVLGGAQAVLMSRGIRGGEYRVRMLAYSYRLNPLNH